MNLLVLYIHFTNLINARNMEHILKVASFFAVCIAQLVTSLCYANEPSLFKYSYIFFFYLC